MPLFAKNEKALHAGMKPSRKTLPDAKCFLGQRRIRSIRPFFKVSLCCAPHPERGAFLFEKLIFSPAKAAIMLLIFVKD